MELDADAARNVGGSEVDLRNGADGLVSRIECGGDIVVVREKAERPGRLGMERRRGTGECDDEQYSELNTNSSGKGHQTTFQWPCKMEHLALGCRPTPFCLYRIAETGLSVASESRDKGSNRVGGSIDRPRRPQALADL